MLKHTEKQLGDFEVEEEFTNGYFLAKKNYFCFNGEKLVKKGFKGVKIQGEYQGRIYKREELEKMKHEGLPLFTFKTTDNYGTIPE